MHQILERADLSPNVTRLTVMAPRIAQIRQPGQFVIVRRGPGAERIPLTIADGDPDAGTIALVIQAVGKSTDDLVELQVGEAITDIVGPLGRPTELLERGARTLRRGWRGDRRGPPDRTGPGGARSAGDEHHRRAIP